MRKAVSKEAKIVEDIEDRIQYQIEAKILIEASKSFLQKDTSSLQEIGITPNKYPDAFEARNNFYHACENTPKLEAIGFEEEPIFPIDRNRFSSMQVVIPRKEDEEEEEWTVETITLKVTSPNWDRKDKKRQWKGKDIDGHKRVFQIEDEEFWTLVLNNKITPHIPDTIKVQWAFQGKSSDPQKNRVLKVLEYNDIVLSEPLEKNAINSILGEHSQQAKYLPDIFDSLNDD